MVVVAISLQHREQKRSTEVLQALPVCLAPAASSFLLPGFGTIGPILCLPAAVGYWKISETTASQTFSLETCLDT